MYIHIYMCTLYIYILDTLQVYNSIFIFHRKSLCVCTYVHLGVKYINNQMDHVQRLRHRRCNHPPFDVLLLRSFNLRNCSFRLVTIVIINNNNKNNNNNNKIIIIIIMASSSPSSSSSMQVDWKMVDLKQAPSRGIAKTRYIQKRLFCCIFLGGSSLVN